jgi:signal transduction histidine kinase
MDQISKPPTVLVVDDDKGLLRLIQKCLQRENFTAVCTCSGNETVAWLSANRADLMLVDLKLADTEASTLIKRLAEIQRTTPFIVITGQGDERVAVDMMKRGALDYLVKDADFLEFLPQVVRRALDQLDKDKRLFNLQKQVIEISEREQRRIGQDLHDGLGQQLTGLEMMCQALKNDPKLASNPARMRAELDNLSEHIRSAIKQTRSLAHGLTSFKIESGGLEIALADLAQSATVAGVVRCRFECLTPVALKDREVATHLYRLAQEAVNNAVKHSKCTQIIIELFRKKDMLHLQISDNGDGFASATNDGVGLGVMQHRAGVIGAELIVKSKPGKGVAITCNLPVRE